MAASEDSSWYRDSTDTSYEEHVINILPQAVNVGAGTDRRDSSSIHVLLPRADNSAIGLIPVPNCQIPALTN